MKKEIFLSIVMPVYNCELYVEETLKSIIQNWSPKFELIIIDDGSTDNSLRKIENLVRNTPEISYTLISQRNQGVSSARNVGIEKSEGRYIYFLDSDDFISNDFKDRLVNILTNLENDMIIFGFNKMRDNQIEWRYLNEFNYCNGVSSGKNIIELYLNQYLTIHICSCIINRKVIIENNIRFDENIAYAEDIDFFLRCLIHSNYVYSIDKELFTYVQHKNSSIRKFDEKRVSGVKGLINLKNYIFFRYTENDKRITIPFDRLIFREIVYTYYSFLSYSTVKDIYKNKKLISNLIGENFDIIKSFDEKNSQLLKYKLILLVCPFTYYYYFRIKIYFLKYFNL